MLAHPVRKKRSGKVNDGYTEDHIVPRCDGGVRYRNVVLAHHSCNQLRRNYAPTEEMLKRCAELWDQAERVDRKLAKTFFTRSDWRRVLGLESEA